MKALVGIILMFIGLLLIMGIQAEFVYNMTADDIDNSNTMFFWSNSMFRVFGITVIIGWILLIVGFLLLLAGILKL